MARDTDAGEREFEMFDYDCEVDGECWDFGATPRMPAISRVQPLIDARFGDKSDREYFEDLERRKGREEREDQERLLVGDLVEDPVLYSARPEAERVIGIMNERATEASPPGGVIERSTIDIGGSQCRKVAAPGTLGASWKVWKIRERVAGVVIAARQSPEEGGAALEAFMADYLKQAPPGADSLRS